MKEEYIPTKYGYARESTGTSAENSKQNIDYQINYLLEQGIKRENIYCDYASGMKEDRIEFQKLKNIIKPKDSLYTLEISRLSRSSKQLIELIEFVRNNHIQLMIGSINVDCREQDLDPFIKGMLQMMSIFAELERNIISSRVKEGVRNAINNGKKVGRPAFDESKIPEKAYKYYQLYKKGDISSKQEVCDILHITRPTFDRWIKYIEK